jgi:hypothetical protein
MDTLITNEIVERREVIDYLLSRMNTNCPGVVISFDAATQTVTVRPAIKMKIKLDGVDQYLTMPPIIKAPCIVPMASVKGFALTLPIATGDPCLIHFSQRCIDNWYEHGGVQPPETSLGTCRHHSLTDALVTFAPNPLTTVFTNWLTTGIEMRNRARDYRITVLDDALELRAGGSSFTMTDDLISMSSEEISITASDRIRISAPYTHIDGEDW